MVGADVALADMVDYLLVFAGGGAGAVARWLLSSIVQQRGGGVFPWGTLAVNLLGSLLLGFVMEASRAWGFFTREQRLFIATGFAGGFTTFSTFSYETLALLYAEPTLALLNIAANIIGGLIAVYLGFLLAGALHAAQEMA